MPAKIQSVLIADEVDSKCDDILRSNGFTVTRNTTMAKDELKDTLKNYDCLVVRSATKVSADIIENGGDNLKLIARAGVGVDNIDVVAATKNKTLVMNTPGSNTISAAELTCAMVSALARQLPQANQSMKDLKWERSKFMGTELYGKTIGIIGLGRIGKEVAIRMSAFGMKCIGYDPIVNAESAAKVNIKLMSLDEIWPIADYLTIHVPLMPETTNLVNDDVIKKCKTGFRIVNCARGGIIDEKALLAGLNSGKCAGAALDVFEEEPTKNFDLIRHPNLICTPHLGASSKEAQNRCGLDVANQIVNYVKNGVLEGGVNANKLEGNLHGI